MLNYLIYANATFYEKLSFIFVRYVKMQQTKWFALIIHIYIYVMAFKYASKLINQFEGALSDLKLQSAKC